MKDNFSAEVWHDMLGIARSVMPDGGPLDDNWPDVRDEIALNLCEEYPDLIDVDASDKIADELMVDAIGRWGEAEFD